MIFIDSPWACEEFNPYWKRNVRPDSVKVQHKFGLFLKLGKEALTPFPLMSGGILDGSQHPFA
jgi:hypothetical protein